MANRFLPKASIWISFLTGLLLPLQTLAGPEQSFTQEFRLSTSQAPITVTAERRLRQIDDTTWQMEIEARNLLGRIREVTRFSWQQCTPQTTSYSYLREGLGQKREATLTLDRQSGMALSTRANGKVREYPISASTTDKLSQTLALQCMLQRGDEELVVDVADEKGREHEHYYRDGEELLQTPAGQLRTVRLLREQDGEDGRRTWLWFAADHNFSLVKLVQEEDNQRHEMLIRSL
ncbi:MAG: DUF3108 domain-containing protein [Alcanivoracaceae bacterium]|jgi:hypothetical protein|nr:DUF3108 domain-containing protein [Alcanivoracaceae bacterium]